MKHILQTVTLFLCLSFTGNSQNLQSNFINYQGVASDASGDVIANTAINLQIALKFGSDTATPSYIENHNPTTDANGLFNIKIGNGTVVTGIYDPTRFGVDASYITVSLNGVEIGTTELNAVPYAMSSGDSQWQLNGTTIENKNTGAVRVTSNLEVVESINISLGATIDEFSTDGTLADNSDTALPTEKAVKMYVDNMTSNSVDRINDLFDAKTVVESLYLGNGAGEANDAANLRSVGIGVQALSNNTASFNTAVGFQTLLLNDTGSDNTALGMRALYINDEGDENTAIGSQSLFSNTTGNSNIAIGYRALFESQTPSFNTAIGNEALYSNTNGSNNIAIGNETLHDNTTGYENIAIGNQALQANTIGDFNTAIGNSALNGNTTGYENTAVGYSALFSNTTGILNTATGMISMYANTTGLFNTANGAGSLNSNTIGNYNTGVGYKSLFFNESGSRNTALGDQTLSENTNGNLNVAIGSEALKNINGSGNTAIGAGALKSSISGSSNVAIGIDAGANETGSGKLYIANSATTTPLIYGDFTISTLIFNGQTIAKNFNDTQADLVLSGSGNTATGDDGIISSDPNFLGSDIFLRSNDNVAVFLDVDNGEDGIFEIYNGQPNLVFSVNESGTTTANSYVNFSDRRLKKDIEDLQYGLKEVLQLQPKAYNWKKKTQQNKSLGLIAQDVQKLIKEVVTTRDDKAQTLGISYTELIPVLINAIKEQQAQIESLKTSNLKKDTTMATILKRITALEHTIQTSKIEHTKTAMTHE